MYSQMSPYNHIEKTSICHVDKSEKDQCILSISTMEYVRHTASRIDELMEACIIICIVIPNTGHKRSPALRDPYLLDPAPIYTQKLIMYYKTAIGLAPLPIPGSYYQIWKPVE